jgi:hypothetical protein
MTVEHRILRKDSPELAGEYENCFYCCRLCNQSRGSRGLESAAAQLLDPTHVAWAEHFEAEGDRLRPRVDDADAVYTYEVYDLDDDRKRARREKRQGLIDDRLELLSRIEGELATLLDLAAEIQRSDPEAFQEAWATISDLRAGARRAYEDLALYPVIPVDAPSTCRCPTARALELPPSLESQCCNLE